MSENPSHILEKTLDQLNLCLKAAQMGIWEGLVLWNPLKILRAKWDLDVLRMHGVPPGENVEPMEWFYAHVPPEDLTAIREALDEFFQQKSFQETLKFNYRVKWPNGEMRYIEMHGSLNKQSPPEGPYTLHGVAKDVTDDVLKRKFIEDQKNRLLANSRMAILGEISGGIAHEINNPLTVIQARSFQLAQMVEANKLDGAKIKSAAESISKTGDKIAKIVKSLRAFAQGQENEPLEQIEIRELIEETLDFCRVRFYNHGIDIRQGDIPGGLEFQGRLIQIEEALLNVFNNAHDAIIPLPEKWILIDACDKGTHVEISVTDSGAGVPENIADNMMQPFFSTKEIGKGMGLGLPIASGIIGKHHGEIFLDRTSAHTKFVLRLPKVQPQ